MRDDKQKAIILQEILDAAFLDEASLDEIFVRYPEEFEALRPQVEAALWLHYQAEKLSPRPDFVQTSRKHLVQRISRQPAVSTETFWQWMVRSLSSPVWRALAGTVALLLIGVVFLGVSSVRAMPEEPLYQAKLAIEDVNLALAYQPVRRTHLQMAYADRRLGEVAHLLEIDKEDMVEEVLHRYEFHVADAVRIVERTSNPNIQQEVASFIAQNLDRQTAQLYTLQREIPQSLQADIVGVVQTNSIALTTVQSVVVDYAGTIPTPALTRRAYPTAPPIWTPPASFPPHPSLPSVVPTLKAPPFVTPQPTGTYNTPTVTATITLTSTGTLTVTFTPTVTVDPSPEPTRKPTNTPHVKPTRKPTNTPQPKPTRKPTNTPRP